MKILITGANGQLGTELRRCIAAGKTELGPLPAKLQRATVLATDVDTLDITNRHEVAAYVRHHAPDAIISCAAFTNVDGCETNREAAFAVNALGARNLAMAAEEIGAKLVHVSTDYVFSGDAAQPVWEYDLPAPRSVYGKTKLLGEQYVQQFCTHYFIVRTAWLYGYAGNNFVKTMLGQAERRRDGGGRPAGQPHQCGGSGPRDIEPAGDQGIRRVPLHGRGRVLLVRVRSRDHPPFRHPRHGDALHDGAVHRRSEKADRAAPGVFGAGKRHAESDYRK